jgi:hypothetical protein
MFRFWLPVFQVMWRFEAPGGCIGAALTARRCRSQCGDGKDDEQEAHRNCALLRAEIGAKGGRYSAVSGFKIGWMMTSSDFRDWYRASLEIQIGCLSKVLDFKNWYSGVLLTRMGKCVEWTCPSATGCLQSVSGIFWRGCTCDLCPVLLEGKGTTLMTEALSVI